MTRMTWRRPWPWCNENRVEEDQDASRSGDLPDSSFRCRCWSDNYREAPKVSRRFVIREGRHCSCVGRAHARNEGGLRGPRPPAAVSDWTGPWMLMHR